MEVTEFGIVIDARAVQFWNATLWIAVTVSGMITVRSDVQFLKASMPISVTVEGIVMDSIAVESVIVSVVTFAPNWTVFKRGIMFKWQTTTESGMVMVSIAEFANIPRSNSRRVGGNATSVSA